MHLSTQKRALIVIAVLASVCGGVWLFARNHSDAPFIPTDEENHTIPPHSRLTEAPHGDRAGLEVVWSWAFASDLRWDQYREWVTRELRDYRPSRHDDRALVFSKQDAGDQYSLTLDHVSDAPLIVKVTFRGDAD